MNKKANYPVTVYLYMIYNDGSETISREQMHKEDLLNLITNLNKPVTITHEGFNTYNVKVYHDDFKNSLLYAK